MNLRFKVLASIIIIIVIIIIICAKQYINYI